MLSGAEEVHGALAEALRGRAACDGRHDRRPSLQPPRGAMCRQDLGSAEALGGVVGRLEDYEAPQDERAARGARPGPWNFDAFWQRFKARSPLRRACEGDKGYIQRQYI